MLFRMRATAPWRDDERFPSTYWARSSMTLPANRSPAFVSIRRAPRRMTSRKLFARAPASPSLRPSHELDSRFLQREELLASSVRWKRRPTATYRAGAIDSRRDRCNISRDSDRRLTAAEGGRRKLNVYPPKRGPIHNFLFGLDKSAVSAERAGLLWCDQLRRAKVRLLIFDVQDLWLKRFHLGHTRSIGCQTVRLEISSA
jgi:hypothetical protein